MSSGEKFQPKSSVISAWVMYIFIAVLVVQTVISSSLLSGAISVVIGGAVATFFYLTMHRPYIVIGDEDILIVNPISTHRFSWLEIESIDTKYTMSVTVGERTINAWAAPATSRIAARKVHAADLRGLNIDIAGTISPGDLPQSDSGVAAYYARVKWNAARNR
jgi:hypothetical protein